MAAIDPPSPRLGSQGEGSAPSTQAVKPDPIRWHDDDDEVIAYSTAGEEDKHPVKTMKMKSRWLDGVNYWPDKAESESLATNVADTLVRTGLCDTLPIYIINAHSAFEPKLQMAAPKGMSAADEAEERTYRVADMAEVDFEPEQASMEKTQGYAVEKDFFTLGRPLDIFNSKIYTKGKLVKLLKDLGYPGAPKELMKLKAEELRSTMPLIPSFVISVSPPGVDSLCGDARIGGSQDWLSKWANLDRVRSCLLSERFTEFMPFESSMSGMFVPPGYPCINKAFQFHELSTRGEGSREKWGVIRLSGLDETRRHQLKGLLERYNHVGWAQQTAEQREEQLYDEEYWGDNSKAMETLWEDIKKNARDLSEMPLSHIVDTLGPGIYIDMSCSGSMIKIWDNKPESRWGSLRDEKERVEKAKAEHLEGLSFEDEKIYDFTVNANPDIVSRWLSATPVNVFDGLLKLKSTGKWDGRESGEISGDDYIRLLAQNMVEIEMELGRSTVEANAAPHFVSTLPDVPATHSKSYLHFGAVYRMIHSDVAKVIHAGRLGWEQIVNKLREMGSEGCDVDCEGGFGWDSTLRVARDPGPSMKPSYLSRLEEAEQERQLQEVEKGAGGGVVGKVEHTTQPLSAFPAKSFRPHRFTKEDSEARVQAMTYMADNPNTRKAAKLMLKGTKIKKGGYTRKFKKTRKKKKRRKPKKSRRYRRNMPKRKKTRKNP